MKMSKKWIPLLLALTMLFSLVVESHAAEANVVEVKSGSTEATVRFTIENALAFEGTVTTKDTTGFKVTGIEEKLTKPEGNWRIEKGPSGDQIVVVGESIPTTINLTVTLKSESPMKDGAYTVTLNYGITNSSGSYSGGKRMTAVIYVGMSAPGTDGGGKSTLSNTTASGPAVTEEEEVVVPEVVTPEEDGSDRFNVIGMLDTAALRSALEEAEKLKLHGELTAAELKMLQEAIDAAEEAMLGDRQTVIDDATYTLETVIEALGGPIEEVTEEEKEEKERSGGGFILPLVLIVLSLLGIAAILFVLYRKKKKTKAYDGAPIVDYEIGDDDIL